jgi:hypothetical protein
VTDPASSRPAAPLAPRPDLAWAFTVSAELASPVELGEADGAQRRCVPIAGGSVHGPALTGVVLAGGADWQTILPDGLTLIEARYLLRADDGTVIEVHNPGLRAASPEVSARIASGEAVDPGDYYFRTTPRLTAPPGRFEWMRRTMFVASGVRLPDRVAIDFYSVS